jgi:choline dehydrogenase-like flavoprotein
MDTAGADITAIIPALAGRPRYNEDGAWVPHRYIPFWLYREQAAGKLDFARGYHIEFVGRFTNPALLFDGIGTGYGASLKRSLYDSYGSRIAFAVRGEMIPNDDCYCDLDSSVTDRFGMPVLRFHWKWGRQELKLVEHALGTVSRIIERMGGKVEGKHMPVEARINAGGSIIHEVGTARMGADPRTSVVNRHGLAWDVPNLLLADGSVFASSPHKNPTLTMMALALRNTEHLVDQLKRGQL